MTFLIVANIISTTKFEILDPFIETFDDFVDDLLSSDLDLLEGELDFLAFQHLLQSIDLEVIKTTDFQEDDSFAA